MCTEEKLKTWQNEMEVMESDCQFMKKITKNVSKMKYIEK